MRLVCNVALNNRNLSSHNLKLQNKHVKSTLALCKHPKIEKEHLLILFTAQNKNGTKYKLTNNVKSVLTKFVNEGKATIQIKEPQIDFYIQADQIQLKGFLMLMKRALEGKVSEKELTLSTLSVSAVPQKNIAPKKLIVKNRSELPTKGYPRTLEEVHINEIGLCKVGLGILGLQRLRILNLSDNSLEFLPADLKKLPIGELNVNKNKLFTLQKWDWIGGTLMKTLQTINLGSNELTYLPNDFIKLTNLVNINLENNKLSSLPSALVNFSKLRKLILTRNNFTFFPGSFVRLRLEHLDICENPFPSINIEQIFPRTLPIQSLKEICSRMYLISKFYYDASILPRTVCDYLDNANYCVCGKPNFQVNLKHESKLILKTIAQICVKSINSLDYVPIECYYCSIKCFMRNYRTILLL